MSTSRTDSKWVSWTGPLLALSLVVAAAGPGSAATISAPDNPDDPLSNSVQALPSPVQWDSFGSSSSDRPGKEKIGSISI